MPSQEEQELKAMVLKSIVTKSSEYMIHSGQRGRSKTFWETLTLSVAVYGLAPLAEWLRVSEEGLRSWVIGGLPSGSRSTEAFLTTYLGTRALSELREDSHDSASAAISLLEMQAELKEPSDIPWPSPEAFKKAKAWLGDLYDRLTEPFPLHPNVTFSNDSLGYRGPSGVQLEWWEPGDPKVKRKVAVYISEEGVDALVVLPESVGPMGCVIYDISNPEDPRRVAAQITAFVDERIDKLLRIVSALEAAPRTFIAFRDGPDSTNEDALDRHAEDFDFVVKLAHKALSDPWEGPAAVGLLERYVDAALELETLKEDIQRLFGDV